MTDRYYAYLQELAHRDQALVILAGCGAASVLAFVLIDKLPNHLQQPARWIVPPMIMGLYVLTAVIGFM